MFNIELIDVHIGRAIKERFDMMNMTKTEFGALIGVPQQHVNRVFEREAIETKKLVAISRALNFNFFTLYCGLGPRVTATYSAVAMGEGDATYNLGDGALAKEVEVLKVRLDAAQKTESDLRDQIQSQKECIKQLQSNLSDKDTIIEIYKQSKI